MTDSTHLGVTDLAALIRAGQIKPSEVMSAHLERIAQSGSPKYVFQFVDPSQAMMRAQVADALPPTGPLHGVPFAIMDTIDTCDMPTGWGVKLYENRVPEQNAACVDTLLSAGAMPIGKTTTPAFAIDETPNGAEAAVAEGLATFALCSRPPCTDVIVAYKPTRKICDLRGIMGLSHTLDTFCILARDPRDLKMLQTIISCDDDQNTESAISRIGFFPGSLQNETSKVTSAEWRTTHEVSNSSEFKTLAQTHATILAFEVARSRAAEAALGPSRVGQSLCDLAAAGARISDANYAEAQRQRKQAHNLMDDMLQNIEALLVSADHQLWSSMNHPCVTLPGPRAGCVQLIGHQGQDARLLDIACRFFEQT
ncbi:amidase family protein [Tropicibacter sp. Alg240-R139]|uniref:amidase family protein n=1 Tax=Tropicibacter sp. Alg240-R139 TaxID=2305991 RepID=UPI0013E032A1|nr:amidase family protein [Tropicibacter sp. Alg240-R139]